MSGSLDSSLKKNTAFIKRLRTTLNAASQATLLAEVHSLSLHKYLSEIISACFEGLCKLKNPLDVAAGLEVVSALHQRFGVTQFTVFLAWHIGRGMTTPDKAQLKSLTSEARDKEERDRLGRQRILLRVLIELWLIGLLRSLDDAARPVDASNDSRPSDHNTSKPVTSSPDAEPFPLEVLKDLLGHDRDHINLPLVVMIAKTFTLDLLGVAKSVGVEPTPAEATGDDLAKLNPANGDALTSQDIRQRFVKIFTRYFDDVKKHIVKDQAKIAAQNKRNAEVYVRVGEIFEDRQAQWEKLVKDQDKLVSNAQVLADVLGVEMPNLDNEESAHPGADGSVGLVKTEDYLRSGNESGLWEDVEERQFYESLIDVKSRVPSVLLEDKKKAPVSEAITIDGESTPAVEQTTESSTADDQSTAIASKTVGAQVDALLARLPELGNKDQVDQCAIDFCFLNSKASRNRLVKALQDVPKARIDLLPLYSRLVATLAVPLPDIASALIAHLDEEFRSLQRRKSKDFLGPVRMLNVRYLAELTKFGNVPEHVIFHCLKVSLDDFSRMNIEIIAGLLENCGRFLLRRPDSNPRMMAFLQALQRKKSAHHSGQQERMLIDNAMYFVDPPERASITQKERTPMDLYIRKLIYMDLEKRTLEKVTKQLRKLHWEENEVKEILRKIFAKPGKIKYGNMHLLAVILGSLHRYHQSFAIGVVDDLVERIYAGLDHNDFRENQERTADVRFLGELYVYRLIDSAIVMDTLYGILTHDHPGGYPRPDDGCTSDAPDDFFRIRLVASLLDVCGLYFDKGLARQKLGFFLAFYQYYICTKPYPPMEVDFVVQDVFAVLRPQWKILTSLDEASAAFATACKQKYGDAVLTAAEAVGDAATSGEGETGEVDPDQGDGESSSEGHSPDESDSEDHGHGADAEDEAHQGQDEDEDDDADSNSDRSADEDEHIVVTRPEEIRDPEADAEFDRELAKLMADSIDSRKSDKKSLFDVPLPLRRTADRTTQGARDEDALDGNDASADASEMMTFSLLSKRGNRQQVSVRHGHDRIQLLTDLDTLRRASK